MPQEDWAYVPPEQERLISETAVAEYVEHKRAEFVEYVLDEAAYVVTVESFDPDTIRSAVIELHHAGYTTEADDDSDDPPAIMCSCHPALFADLIDSLDFMRHDSDKDTTGVYGVECGADHALPEGKAVCVHPDAVIPSIQSQYSFKPWLVRDGRGIVEIRVHPYD